MPESQDQFVASIASEAVEVLEDHLLFQVATCCRIPPAAHICPVWQNAPGLALPQMSFTQTSR